MTIQHASVIPTDAQIRALHERFAPTEEAFDLVYTHCRIVCEVAEQLLDRHRPAVDVELVRAGSLLHDIGVYRLYGPTGRLDHGNYIRHGVLGQALLRDLGLPEPVSRFCAHHTGVGLTRDDVLRQGLPLPVGDYTADTAEELLVMYADKFHSKSTPPAFLTAASYAAKVRRFGADNAARFAALVERFGEPDLPALSERYGHPVR
ncbi:HD domain-containing protein [Micromonospora sp. PLK6-60]|uniref:HD domain-containing protein n=1 Tax=Micromonospora sp. PLK6-60 TaxID=2873383 RepID=UPI0027E13FCE|nr:HD domain-containing protein [Micromonospora sp. PLK6-60]